MKSKEQQYKDALKKIATFSSDGIPNYHAAMVRIAREALDEQEKQPEECRCPCHKSYGYAPFCKDECIVCEQPEELLGADYAEPGSRDKTVKLYGYRDRDGVTHITREEVEQPEEPTAFEVPIKNESARKRAAKLKKEEDERLAKRFEELTPACEAPCVNHRCACCGLTGLVSKSKLLELAEDMRMEEIPEEDCPHDKPCDTCIGWNRCVRRNNKNLDTFISKLKD